MPVYNSLNYLKDSVPSILSQSLSDFHFLIINDGSNDETSFFLSKIKDNRIKVINKSHTGISDSFNFGLNYVDTPFVARIDSDDIYLEHKFRDQLNYLEQNRDVAVLGTGIQYVSENLERRSWKVIPPLTHETIVSNILSMSSGLYNTTTMYNYDLLKQSLFLEKNVYPEDLNLFLKLGLNYKFANLSKVQVLVRIHKSYSGTNFNALLRNFENILKVYQPKYSFKYPKNIYSNSLDINFLSLYREALNEYLNGNIVRGIAMLIRCAYKSPERIKRIIVNEIKSHL